MKCENFREQLLKNLQNASDENKAARKDKFQLIGWLSKLKRI